MPKLMLMEKDGIVLEVVPSAFRNVHSRRGWKVADPDAQADPAELGLGPDQSLEDYKSARDQARQEAKDAEEAADKALADAEAARRETEADLQGQAPVDAAAKASTGGSTAPTSVTGAGAPAGSLPAPSGSSPA